MSLGVGRWLMLTQSVHQNSCEERNWFVLIPAALIHSHPHQIIELITGFGWKALVLCHGLRDVTDLVEHQCCVFCVFINF